MNKREIYNGMVNVYKQSGQGVPKMLFESFIDSINELISEGKIKEVTTVFNHLPNDHWYCLTDVYCVEDYGHKTLGFMKLFLNVEEEDSMFKLEKDENYNNWLEENKEQLKKIKDLQHYNEVVNVVEPIKSNDSLINTIRKYKSYKNNKSVDHLMNNCNERIGVNKQIISLAETGLAKYGKNKYKEEIKNCESDIVKVNNMINFLDKFEKGKQLQDCF